MLYTCITGEELRCEARDRRVSVELRQGLVVVVQEQDGGIDLLQQP